MTAITSTITRELIDQSMDYAQYRILIDQLLLENKTTGNNHSAAMMDYTRINVQRMKRWDKTSKVSEEAVALVKKLERKQIWLVLTEAWCGDAAQNISYIEKLAAFNEKVKVRYILRDENLAVMDEFLTNGGRSIPKLIALDEKTLDVLFTWGPRPQPLQEMMLAFKEDPQGVSTEEFKKTIHLWYAKDKNQTLDSEFKVLLTQ
ncbi:thioredoxin family protein [Echinicola soli]|uniref:Thioredoxin family protein n=1 Tax=Echinicola soli TaxID=2591634 RepID=A0A514CCU1_9BACT|nr:thioredoxin family protein [Echinicola soli]QDH77600.1 thioredoxin family protein [Echinicola soli]